MMNDNSLKYILDRIILNDEVLKSNNLSISNLKCTEEDGIILSGSINTQQMNLEKPAVVGAYVVQDNSIKYVTATALILRQLQMNFELMFYDDDFDTIYLYADMLTKDENVQVNSNIKEDMVERVTYNTSQSQTPPTNSSQSKNKMNLMERLKSSIELEDVELWDLGLKFVNYNVVRKSSDVGFTIFTELQCKKSIDASVDIYCVIYDKYNNILDSRREYLDLNTSGGTMVYEWTFETKASQVEKIRIFSNYQRWDI